MKITPEDKLFSEFIRKRAMQRVGGCERCLTLKFDTTKDDGSTFPAWKTLQCSHIWGRNNKSVRYDEDDAFGLCGGCHTYLEHNPDEHKEFALRKLGQGKYDMLKVRATRPFKPDIKLLTIYYKEKIKKLEVKNEAI